MNSMLLRAPVMADFADALADAVATDRSLGRALVLNETWNAGYVDRLLGQAEVLGAQLAELSYMGVDGLSPTTVDRARHAVQRALALMNPKVVLAYDVEQPTDEEVETLFEMVRAYARFHRLSGHLERRSHRRFSTFFG